MKNMLLLPLCLISYFSVAQDYFQPSGGFFEGSRHATPYHKAVRDSLFIGLRNTPTVRVVVLPSFSPEYLIAVERYLTAYQLIFRTFDKSIRTSLDEKTGVMKPIKRAEWRRDISRDLGERLAEFFFLTTSEARYPPVEYITFPDGRKVIARSIGVDGTTYQCVASVVGSDVRSGKIYSPREGSKMARLVGLIELMGMVAKENAQEAELTVALGKLEQERNKK